MTYGDRIFEFLKDPRRYRARLERLEAGGEDDGPPLPPVFELCDPGRGVKGWQYLTSAEIDAAGFSHGSLYRAPKPGEDTTLHDELKRRRVSYREHQPKEKAAFLELQRRAAVAASASAHVENAATRAAGRHEDAAVEEQRRADAAAAGWVLDRPTEVPVSQWTDVMREELEAACAQDVDLHNLLIQFTSCQCEYGSGQEKSASISLQHECSARARAGKSIHASRALREMIARPKISQNEWKTTEI